VNLPLKPHMSASNPLYAGQDDASALQGESFAKTASFLDTLLEADTDAEPRGGSHATEIVFDASDLISYFKNARLPTGIQRVQIEIISGFAFAVSSKSATTGSKSRSLCSCFCVA
jgi:hypothetical protein